MMYTLDSGIQLHNEAPETFWIPSKEVKHNLKVDDVVKLVFREDSVERMWVIITKVVNNVGFYTFEGVLDNQPYYLQSIKAGDKVEFNEDHIINIG